MFKTTDALVLREVHYKEADRILTLLTASDGKITAKARGALRKGSKTAAATQQLTFSEMTLFENNGKWTVNEASVKEGFPGLRADIADYSLGCYIAECTDYAAAEDNPDPLLMQLALNSLYALSNKMYPPEHIKAAFELRLMCMEGYEPDMSGCCVCGKEMPEEAVLCLDDGCICCGSCRRPAGEAVFLGTGAMDAMRYICCAPAKQLFSFKTDKETAEKLSAVCERYILYHSGRSFGTLDYWKKVKTPLL